MRCELLGELVSLATMGSETGFADDVDKELVSPTDLFPAPKVDALLLLERLGLCDSWLLDFNEALLLGLLLGGRVNSLLLCKYLAEGVLLGLLEFTGGDSFDTLLSLSLDGVPLFDTVGVEIGFGEGLHFLEVFEPALFKLFREL